MECYEAGQRRRGIHPIRQRYSIGRRGRRRQLRGQCPVQSQAGYAHQLQHVFRNSKPRGRFRVGYLGVLSGLPDADAAGATILPSHAKLSLFKVPEPGFDPRGVDIDSHGVVWTALAATSHLASFDVRKCKDLGGPAKVDGSPVPRRLDRCIKLPAPS